MQKSRLLTEQRRRRVLDLVDQDGQATVADIAKRFSISAVTARGDLDTLASIGAVVRSHGGAVRRLEAAQDYPLRTKEAIHREEKIRIGRAAAELIQPGETVILDSGTTTAEIARHLKLAKIQSVTVITNALNIAGELMDAPGISLIMIGGLLRPVSCSFVGPQAEAMMNEVHADRLFLAVDGFDLENGPSTPDVLEAQLNNVMIRSAREVNVVADFSKLGRRSVSKIGPFESIRRLITDSRATSEFTAALRKKGIEVIEV
ncbi:MAG TPA: DeoR/GlpR family DNA-binding transcription regulator [Candidatus Saccharimonadales bacterium]|nr:DeoR/GlpR family DNA-binding transcription regulator [Candidatus Saccharimonadales bacterium]